MAMHAQNLLIGYCLGEAITRTYT